MPKFQLHDEVIRKTEYSMWVGTVIGAAKTLGGKVLYIVQQNNGDHSDEELIFISTEDKLTSWGDLGRYDPILGYTPTPKQE